MHALWEAYLAPCRKVETGGRGTDEKADLVQDLALMREFLAIFRGHLEPPARVLVPGGLYEALLLAEAGYGVVALQLGPDNIALAQERAQALPRPDLLTAVEQDAHDLRRFPAGHFDGYFSIQFHEHLIAPEIHVGEAHRVLRDGAPVFVDACGTTNPATMMGCHTNRVPEACVWSQWARWGFREVWRGPHGDERPQFIFRREGGPAWT